MQHRYSPSLRDALWLRRAVVHAKQGRPYHARVVLSRLVSHAPQFHAAWALWAEVEHDLGVACGTGGYFESLAVLSQATEDMVCAPLARELEVTLHLQHGMDVRALDTILYLSQKWPDSAARVYLVWATTKYVRKQVQT
jgi:hypothetical protein